MKNPIDNFWKLKLENVKESLESNNFEVFIADNSVEASKIVLEKIIPTIDIKSILKTFGLKQLTLKKAAKLGLKGFEFQAILWLSAQTNVNNN